MSEEVECKHGTWVFKRCVACNLESQLQIAREALEFVAKGHFPYHNNISTDTRTGQCKFCHAQDALRKIGEVEK